MDETTTVHPHTVSFWKRLHGFFGSLLESFAAFQFVPLPAVKRFWLEVGTRCFCGKFTTDQDADPRTRGPGRRTRQKVVR